MKQSYHNKVLSLGRQEHTVNCKQHRPFALNVALVAEMMEHKFDRKLVYGKIICVPKSVTVKEVKEKLGYSQMRANDILLQMEREGILVQTAWISCGSRIFKYSLAT